MFPIPWNREYRKKDGTLVKISDAMSGGGGGSDLPPHSSSDAGKVLTVDSEGNLEWNENGAGGGILLNESYSRNESGGETYTYNKTYVVTTPGTYQIIFSCYSERPTLKINNVTQTPDVDSQNNYVYFYNKTVELTTNDEINFVSSSYGKSVILAQVIKLD